MNSGGPGLGDIIGWVRDAGTIGVLVIVVWGAMQEWWITGRQYRRVLNERDWYRDQLFRVIGMTDRASRALDRVTKRVLDDSDENRSSRLEAEREVRRYEDESR